MTFLVLPSFWIKVRLDFYIVQFIVIESCSRFPILFAYAPILPYYIHDIEQDVKHRIEKTWFLIL